MRAIYDPLHARGISAMSLTIYHSEVYLWGTTNGSIMLANLSFGPETKYKARMIAVAPFGIQNCENLRLCFPSSKDEPFIIVGQGTSFLRKDGRMGCNPQWPMTLTVKEEGSPSTPKNETENENVEVKDTEDNSELNTTHSSTEDVSKRKEAKDRDIQDASKILDANEHTEEGLKGVETDIGNPDTTMEPMNGEDNQRVDMDVAADIEDIGFNNDNTGNIQNSKIAKMRNATSIESIKPPLLYDLHTISKRDSQENNQSINKPFTAEKEGIGDIGSSRESDKLVDEYTFQVKEIKTSADNSSRTHHEPQPEANHNYSFPMGLLAMLGVLVLSYLMSPARASPTNLGANCNGDSHLPPMPYTCLSCAKRKVKCDKATPMCSRCRKGKLECFYQAPSSRRRKRRLSGDADINERLARYERILHQHGLLPQDADTLPSTEEIPQEPLPHHGNELEMSITGKLLAGQGKSRYIDNIFWSNLGGDEMQRMSDEEEEEEDDDDEVVAGTPGVSHRIL
ncbi:hypothetical protein G7Y89_g400 [Cudoniella acicularis]|uniref:Zn(2)-C6 fungal-type domain-containing protein n=1 Tax=Cudoniella acicularis TaxID=354080 RepID=A0A8H4S000_9HELO|nr:hypothetical protein G7Y89_g400 [Cudoniella acicularis]